MGFWDSMKRMAMGEPVFQPGDNVDKGVPLASEPHADSQPVSTDQVGMHNGQKIIPEVEIEHIECHESGDNVEIWATLQNHGSMPVFLDKIVILGQKTELDYELAPGGARQSRLYHGPTPTTNAYTYTEMDYRLVATGDYFRGRYTIEYHYEDDDHQYLPRALRLQHPVRDI
jgi:hypothetical protein